MTDAELRALVADDLARTHDNPLFLQQVREGGQDDGPDMRGALLARNAMLERAALRSRAAMGEG